MKKVILPLAALSFSTLTASADTIDEKVDNLKKQGFDVEIETKKIKVNTFDEYKQKQTDEKTRLSQELNRLINHENNYNQQVREQENTNTQTKKTNEKIIEEWLTNNDRIKKENAKLEQEYNNKVQSIENKYNQELEQYNKDVEKITKLNEQNKTDYNKKIQELQDYKKQLDTEYANKVKEVQNKNKELETNYLKQVETINKNNEAKKQAYEQEVASVNEYNKNATEENTRIDTIIKANETKKADYEKQKTSIEAENNKLIEDYNRKLTEVKAENERLKQEYVVKNREIEAENSRLSQNNEQEKASILAENERLKQEYETKKAAYTKKVKALQAEYETRLAKYKKAKQAAESEPTVATNNGVTLYGSPNEAGRKSAAYFNNYNILVEKDNVEALKDSITFGDNSEITNLTGGIRFKQGEIQGNITYAADTPYAGNTYRQFVLENLTKGSTFTLTNVGKTTSGKNVNLKFTILKDYNDVANKLNQRATDPSWVIFEQTKPTKSLGITVINMDSFYTHIDYVDDEGNPINLATMLVNSDVDYGQGLGYKFTGTNASTINFNPQGSNLQSYNLRGVEHLIDYAVDMDHTHGLSGLASTPEGTFITVGTGTGLDVSFLNSDSIYKNVPNMSWKTSDSEYTVQYLKRAQYNEKLTESYATTRPYYQDVGSYFDMFGRSETTMEVVVKPEPPSPNNSLGLIPPKAPEYKELPSATPKPLLTPPSYKVTPERPSEHPIPNEPTYEEVGNKKVLKKEPTKPTYEKLPEKPNYLTEPSKPSYPDFSPTKLPEKPLPTKPVKEQLPEKPNYKKELEKPKEIPNENKEVKKEPIKITKYVYEYEKTSSATSLKVHQIENKRSASGNSLTIKRI